MKKKEEHRNCLICRNEKLRPVKWYEKHGLVRCPNCGFVFSKWIPSVQELNEHYKTYTRNDSISQITLNRYHELADSFEKYKQKANWMDVGCGNGHLLKTVSTHGWNVFGTEFTREAVEICRSKGINMQEGPLNVNNYPPASFDVLTSIEVIEHIHQVHEEAEKFSRLLRKGGLLYLTTPNFNSLSKYLLKENWSIVEYPEHLSYFTPVTIDRLLSAHGFRKLKIRTTGISISRLGGNHASDQSASFRAKEEKLREAAEGSALAGAAKKIANTLLTLSGSGDALKAWYIRI